MENELIILCVTGHPASGKDTVADYFISKGFAKISGGDILREEMQKLGLPIDRPHVYEFVKEMRQQHGNSYPAEKVIERITGNTVVAGFRNLEEVGALRQKFSKNFKLIAVNAPIEVRYQRALQRGRVCDNISFEQFKAEDERERAVTTGSHEVDLVMSTADIMIENDSTPEELFRKVDKILDSIN